MMLPHQHTNEFFAASQKPAAITQIDSPCPEESGKTPNRRTKHGRYSIQPLKPHRDQIVADYQSGHSTNQIAERFGVPASVVVTFLKGIGEPRRTFSQATMLTTICALALWKWIKSRNSRNDREATTTHVRSRTPSVNLGGGM